MDGEILKRYLILIVENHLGTVVENIIERKFQRHGHQIEKGRRVSIQKFVQQFHQFQYEFLRLVDQRLGSCRSGTAASN